MTSCEAIRDDLPLLLVGELPAARADELRAHLSDCRGCCAELELQQRVLGALRDVPAARGERRRPRLLPLGVAAAVVLAFASGVAVGRAQPTVAPGSTGAADGWRRDLAAAPDDLTRGLLALRRR